MATEESKSQITNGEIEETTAESSKAPENVAEALDISEGQVDAEIPESKLSENAPKSEKAELKESTEIENVSETLESENSSQAVIEEERKGENSSKVNDTKATENIDSSTGEITDTAQPSTTVLTEENKQNEEKKKALERQRRGRRTGKGILVRKLASLNLPDGVILVQDRQYTGYHCTYCNCVLRSLATVKAHVDGKWHRRTLQIRDLNDGRKAKVTTPSKSTPKASPKVPLKSSLEDYLSTVNTTIVGLSYIVETQRPDKKPTFQCNLCEISCDTANIKDHINGMKHCLMYLKLVKPTQLAELLAKQLSKTEKNKEIAKLSEELQRENGHGKIVVKSVQEKETTAAELPRNKPPNRFQNAGSKFSSRSQREGRAGNWFSNRPHAAGNRSNRPVARTTNVNQRNISSRGARRENMLKPSQQKRKNEGISPARKRQLLERDFQARVQYSRERAQNNFFSGRWGMGNKPMNMNFYSDYPDFYPDPYNERRALNRRPYMNESYDRMSQFPERNTYLRERYEDRQSRWNDRRDSFASNNPRSHSSHSTSMFNAESSRNANVQLSTLKQLAGLNVTSEEDAGVVINAINSLTNSFMNYKLRDLSGPVQQLLQKSLKSSDLKSLLDVPVRNPARSIGNVRDRYDGRSSQMNRGWGISQIAKPKNWLF